MTTGLETELSERFGYKQALIFRLDLKIGRGKIAVQCAHAAVGASEEARYKFPDWWKNWLEEGQRKIALKVPGLEEILKLQREASAKRLPVSLVKDMGLTQIPPGTVTCVGIGPAPSRLIDELTGDLPLL